nr:hypothetical protein [Tanacetum cinerariifolium]
MFETGTYKSLPKHVALYEALEASMECANREELLTKMNKSRKRRRNGQDLPPSPPDLDLSKRRRQDTNTSGLLYEKFYNSLGNLYKLLLVQVMEAPNISISLDVSVERVGSSFSRLILIGSSSVEVPAAPKMGAAGHYVLGHSLYGHTLRDTTVTDSSTPLMTSESSARDSSSESSTGPSWKRCRSPAATMTSSIHVTRALVPSRADLLLSRKRFRDFISPKDSVKEGIDTDVLEDIEANAIAIEVAVVRDVVAEVDAGIDMEGVTFLELSARDSSSKSSTGPSRKRCRSLATTMTSSIHATIALVSSRADLLLSRKRFRDFISPKDSVKEGIDTDVLEDIEANATAIEVAVVRDVVAEVDAGIDMEVDAVKLKTFLAKPFLRSAVWKIK